MEESFYDTDNISSLSLDDVAEKLRIETARPEGFTVTKLDSELLIYLLQVSDSIPSIRACITVKENLSTVVSLDGKSFLGQFADFLQQWESSMQTARVDKGDVSGTEANVSCT